MMLYVAWPAYDPVSDLEMTMQTPACTAATNVRAQYCNFWDKLGYTFQ